VVLEAEEPGVEAVDAGIWGGHRHIAWVGVERGRHAQGRKLLPVQPAHCVDAISQVAPELGQVASARKRNPAMPITAISVPSYSMWVTVLPSRKVFGESSRAVAAEHSNGRLAVGTPEMPVEFGLPGRRLGGGMEIWPPGRRSAWALGILPGAPVI